MFDEHDHKQRLLESIPAQPSSMIEMLMMGGDDQQVGPDWTTIELVQECVQQLERPHQTLIELVFYHRYSYNEITEIVGYSSKSHTWYHVRKALDELKKKLLEHPQIREMYDNH